MASATEVGTAAVASAAEVGRLFLRDICVPVRRPSRELPGLSASRSCIGGPQWRGTMTAPELGERDGVRVGDVRVGDTDAYLVEPTDGGRGPAAVFLHWFDTEAPDGN